jgi:hypothetical protein
MSKYIYKYEIINNNWNRPPPKKEEEKVSDIIFVS